ncbi:MAG: hypothetical protein GY725_24115, partial [bacterium]|nr:hypothetical protein [bacterium]
MFALVALLLSVFVTLLALEVAIRLYHGDLFSTRVLTQTARSFGDDSFLVFDPDLGHVPREGQFE